MPRCYLLYTEVQLRKWMLRKNVTLPYEAVIICETAVVMVACHVE